MKTVLIIPARYGSTRLPGKPLINIAGKPLIERVWQIAAAVKNISGLHVATDDARIAEAVSRFGGQAVMTPVSCKNGTERSLAAIDALGLEPDVVVNLQGDAPLTPPHVIQALIDEMAVCTADICTPAIRLTGYALKTFLAEKAVTPASGTSVVVNGAQEALYFSKSVLPFSRHALNQTPAHVLRHIGLYAYRLPVLRALCALPESPLEVSEGLEQLRALENGYKVKVVLTDYNGRSLASVDAPEDVARVEAIIRAEGEVV